MYVKSMKYNYIKRHILNSYKKLFFDSDLLAVLQHGPRPGGGQGGHGGPLDREHHVHRHLLSHLHRKFMASPLNFLKTNTLLHLTHDCHTPLWKMWVRLICVLTKKNLVSSIPFSVSSIRLDLSKARIL